MMYCKPAPIVWDSKTPEEMGTGSPPYSVVTANLSVAESGATERTESHREGLSPVCLLGDAQIDESGMCTHTGKH